MILGNEVRGRIETDRWYDIRIEVAGKVRCYLDGKLIHDINYPITQTLYAVAGLNKTGDEVILKVVNAPRRPGDRHPPCRRKGSPIFSHRNRAYFRKCDR